MKIFGHTLAPSLTLNKGQEQARDYVRQGYNVFITGDQGTGKSLLIQALLQDNYLKNKNVVLAAPMGIAALNIGGVTLHRAVGLPTIPFVENDVTVNKTMRNCDILIVDEIGTCRIDWFDYLALVIKKVNEQRERGARAPIQVVFVGDFFQLAPVITERDREALEVKYKTSLGRGYAFQSKNWAELGLVHIRLNEHMRQHDGPFTSCLNSIKFGHDNGALDYISRNSAPYNIDNGIRLCGTNKRVRECNEASLAALKGKSYIFEPTIVGEVKDSDKAAEDIIEVKIGARVMTLINDSEQGFFNGSIGTIVEVQEGRKPEDTKIIIESDEGKTWEVGYYTWGIMNYTAVDDGKGKIQLKLEPIGSFTQMPIKLAYAMTIHKAQGKTFEAVNLEPKCWEAGQLYVALSRVKDIKNLHIEGRLYSSSLIAAPEVEQFYTRVFGN